MFEGQSSMGCVVKLYESAKNLSDKKIISTECMEMLLSPNIERMCGCSNQLLQIEEKTIPSVFIRNVLVLGRTKLANIQNLYSI